MYFQHVIRAALVLVLWAVLAVMAWAVVGASGAEPARAAAAAPQAGGHYVDQAHAFSFDYPARWTPEALGPGDAPGSVLGLTRAPVPGSVGGVEFPYSSHIDLSVIVRDPHAGGGGWGGDPATILREMAASQGKDEAAMLSGAVPAVTPGGVTVWTLEYSPANATQHMWVVAQGACYDYLFFLTVGGAADDRGTVQQMFAEVMPSLVIAQ